MWSNGLVYENSILNTDLNTFRFFKMAQTLFEYISKCIKHIEHVILKNMLQFVQAYYLTNFFL